MTQAAAAKKPNTMRLVLLIAVVVLGIWTYINREPAKPSTPAPDLSYVSRAEFGDKWPLTVDNGYVSCIGGQYVLFRNGPTLYALNGTAVAHGTWQDIAAIRNGNDLRPILERGLAQCH